MKFLINVFDVPKEIEAEDYKDASEKVMEFVDIISKEDLEKL